MNGRKWTADEIAILRARYPSEPREVVAAAVGHPAMSVESKASDLGIRKSPKHREWTARELRVLRKRYATTISSELALELNRTLSQIYAKAAELGLKKAEGFASRVVKAKLATGWRSFGSAWTPAQIAILRERFATTPTRDLVEPCGHSLSSTHQMAMKLGLNKTPDHVKKMLDRVSRKLKETGKAHRWAKGHVPANKGLRRPGWHTGRMRDTQFKKGQMPRNHLPVGSVTWSTGRIQNGVMVNNYLKIKVAEPNAWRWLHRKTWEDAYGPIPRGYGVGFIDGNRANVALSNLVLMSASDRARVNNMWNRYPLELAQVIQLKGALKRVINRRAKREEQNRRSA